MEMAMLCIRETLKRARLSHRRSLNLSKGVANDLCNILFRNFRREKAKSASPDRKSGFSIVVRQR